MISRKLIASALLALVLFALAPMAMADSTKLLRQPALSANHLAFVYAGDLWVARPDGSDPRRLTSHPANESNPVFSPDGQWLAFSADYERNTDVYVISVEGGQPKRLTWHPGADIALDWSADGSEVALVSYRESDHGRSGQLYHVSIDGGLPQKQMDARIYRGTYSSDGQFAYIPFGSGYNGLFGGTAGWKGYRGGTTPAINIMSADKAGVVTIPGAGATNFNTLWLDNGLYFLSDRADRNFQLFHFDAATQAVTQVTNESGWDIRAAGGHGSTVVYEAGGQLKRLDINSGEVSDLQIEIAPDLAERRPQWKNAADTITDAQISRTGKRAVVTARGEVFTVPVSDGSTRNLSNTGTRREYSAMWSPDGQQLAWISETGEGTSKGQEVVISDQSGNVSARHPLGTAFYQLLAWSAGETPRLVYMDNHLGLHVLNLGNGRSTQVATQQRRDVVEVAISPDGNWLAYTLEQPNYHRDLMLLELGTRNSTRVSDGLADVGSPAFSPDGSYLFFAASTNSGPIQVGLNMTSQERPFRAGLYAAVLSSEGDSPLKPASGDEEAPADENEDSEEETDESENPTTRVDVDGLSNRIVALPVAEENYGNLAVGEDGSLFYISFVQAGTSVAPPGSNPASGNTLKRFNFEDEEESTVLRGVNDFAISSDGAHMIIQKADGSLATAEIADELSPESLDLGGVRVFVDPAEEWAQIFDEAWRMEREYFYAENMHGLDWEAMYAKYRPLLPHAGRRDDVNELLVEMIAEMMAGHNRVGGGDRYRDSAVDVGLLGANLETHDGRYRIAKVYSGESWNPFLQAPLAQPGSEAYAGEYILAVNGQELDASDNIFALLQGTTGEQVTLRVGPEADGDNARDIVVTPTDDEDRIRLWNWIENNRKQVAEATDGRVGYIYLPNTAGAGYTYFNRMFFPQVDKEALIIDERSNGGGQAANYIIDVLSRKHLSGWKDRDGLVFNTPAGAMHGPKLMMIDQDAGSGGDYLPHTFRYAGIGKLLGTRTWGGLIGIFANPQLMDGGVVTVPFFRFFEPDGSWSVENEGVAPDIEVLLDPIATNRGEDSQLDAAIEEIMMQLDAYENEVLTEAPPVPTELGE